MMQTENIFLPNSATLPDSGPSRKSKTPEKYLHSTYYETYDTKTLWYDAIEDNGLITLVCPKLNNLEPVLKMGQFKVDGRKVQKPKIRKFRRTDLVELPVSGPATQIEFETADFTLNSKISKTEHDLFSGLNTLLLMNKNNDLEWIRDHIKWHMAHHGLEAVMIMDNNSDRYKSDNLIPCLKDTGLKQVALLKLPFTYGAFGITPFRFRELYLQTSAYNISRLRFLQQARAVLSCDVDELLSPGPGSIFERALASRSGFVRVKGSMRYHDLENTSQMTHVGGYFRIGTKLDSAPKWCIVPSGRFKGYNWAPHSLEKLLLERFYIDKSYEFWHFFHVSTNWQGNRESQIAGLSEDPDARDLLSKTLGQTADRVAGYIET